MPKIVSKCSGKFGLKRLRPSSEEVILRVTRDGEIIGEENWRKQLWELERKRAGVITERLEQKQEKEYSIAIELNERYMQGKSKMKRTAPSFKKKTLYEEHGDRIAEMWEKKFTQKQIAALLGISSQSVWNILNRRAKEGKNKK